MQFINRLATDLTGDDLGAYWVLTLALLGTYWEPTLMARTSALSANTLDWGLLRAYVHDIDFSDFMLKNYTVATGP